MWLVTGKASFFQHTVPCQRTHDALHASRPTDLQLRSYMVVIGREDVYEAISAYAQS